MEAENQKAESSLSCFVATASGFRKSLKHSLTCWGTWQQLCLLFTKQSCIECVRKRSCMDSGARSNCKQCAKPAHLWLLGQVCR